MKVKIFDSNKKSYAKHYRPTSSTTLDWHYVQPLFCRMMMPSSKLKVDVNQFIRLSPLTFPVFGDIRLVNKAFFIPIEQVMPNFASFLSEKPYALDDGSFITPKSLPFTSNRELMFMLLNSVSAGYSNSFNKQTSLYGGNYDKLCTLTQLRNVYRRSTSADIDGDDFVNPSNIHVDADNFVSAVREASSGVDDFDVIMSKVCASTGFANSDLVRQVMTHDTYDADALQTSIDDIISSCNQADYVQVCYYKGSDSSQDFYCNNFYHFNMRGRAVRKILIGLGYNPSLDDHTQVSLLPLLAFYKAYFDNMYPKRHIDWEQTACFRAIQLMSKLDYSTLKNIRTERALEGQGAFLYSVNTTLPSTDIGVKAADALRQFFYGELARCYSVEDMDFISMHQSSISTIDATSGVEVPSISPSAQISQPRTGSVNDFKSDTYYNDDTKLTNNSSAYVYADNNKPITKWSLQFLNRLQSYFNKDSIIGNRISLWLKSHFDSDTLNLIYRSTGCIASSMDRVQISDIDSLADTLSADGTTGNGLGAYAGKGVGNSRLHVSYDASTFGYMIVLTYILPVTGYYQGTSPELFALDKFDMPSSEFDALGYEVSPRALIWTDNGISLESRNDYRTIPANAVNTWISSKDGFGYVPRMSGFKYLKNIVNGDFSLRRLKPVMSAFYIDKDLTSRALPNPTTVNPSFSQAKSIINIPLPCASSAWQYVAKYGNLNNYQRIFQNSAYSYPFGYTGDDYALDENLDDNFLLHSVFNVTEINSLKPLNISFDTSVDDGPSTNVHPS